MEENIKKSRYNAEAQRKYNADKRVMSCKLTRAKYDEVEKYFKEKGFESANSYLTKLIDDDIDKR